MHLSLSNISALQEITQIACAKESAGERIERVLDIARESMGLTALSVVLTEVTTSKVREWKSTSGQVNGKHISVPISVAEEFAAEAVAVGDNPDLSFLQVMCGYLSVLLENVVLTESFDNSNAQARKRMEEIAAIYDIGQAIYPSENTDLLDLIVAKAAAVMDGQTCSLMMRNPLDGTLVIQASYGLSDEIVKGVQIALGEGIAGKVAQTGEPMLILDVASDPRFSDGVRARSNVSGSMCVPLRDQAGGIAGVLSIRRHHPKPPFGEDDLKLFGVFATHAALAISGHDLYTRLHQKVQEMSTISDVLKSINSTLDLEYVLNQILDSITEVVGFDRCCVYLLDTRSGDLALHAQRGYGRQDAIPETVRFDDGGVGLAAKERIPIFSQDDLHNSPISGQRLITPIVVRNRSIGVVVADNSLNKKPIEPQRADLLATFVNQAGIAVENARLYEAMEKKYAELNVLYEQSKSISAASGLESAAQMLVTTASKVVQCDGAGLLLLDPRRDKLKLQAVFGTLGKTEPHIQDLLQSPECVQLVRNQRNPLVTTSGSSERKFGPVADMLNALAPANANLMIVPLVVEDTPIGLLALNRDRPECFLPGELQLVAIVATHAATVLKNTIAYEQKMQQKVLKLSALYEFSQKISSAGSLEQALDSILAVVANVVDYDESYIYAVEDDNGTASVRASLFREDNQDASAAELLGDVTSWVTKEHVAIVSPDITHDPRFDGLITGGTPVRSLMSTPLIVQDEVVGILNVCSYSPNVYTEDDVRVLCIIASQGAAIYKELEALAALTSYTDNILSSIAAGVATLDYDGVLLTWNMAAENIVGLRASRIEGLHYEDLLARLKIKESDKALLRQAVQSVSSTGITYQGYKLAFHPEKRGEVYINLSISPLLNNAGEQLGLVLIFEDITREIKMENEFRRMGELAAIGQLAASIAHELRNPLSSIKGAAQFLSNEYENEEAIVEFLGIIIDEVNGLNKLTTEFLDYGRPMQLELKPVSLNMVVDKTLQLMSVHIANNEIGVKEEFDTSISQVQADESRLQQVLRNIIINALQAMPDGGSLAVRTGKAPGGGAYVSVTDSGCGIAKDKLERIFVPFFTTKTKGTGLGLSVVHKIIENHGGSIEVSSDIGKGSTFTIVLPSHGARSPIEVEEIDQTLERRISGKLRGEADLEHES